MNWSQLQTILWLRWRLNANQWTRGNKLNAVIAAILAVGGLAMAAGGGLGGVLAGAVGLRATSPHDLLVLWDAILGVFLLCWVLGVVTELQRAESIDIRRLLHLPVSLPGIFLVNYVASHVRPVLILFLPGMLGLVAGLALGRSLLLVLLFPLVLGFVFMITAWTYCLRGWLVSLMVNQRRRRAILVSITMGLILISQAPNLYFNVMLRRHPRPGRSLETSQTENPGHSQNASAVGGRFGSTALTVHQAVPVLWTAYGAMTLANGQVWPALGGSAGALLIGALGLYRAYRGTLRFYQGLSGGDSTAPAAAKKAPRRTSKNWLETELPGVPAEAAAMALASFRSLTRAPEVKLALASSFIVMVLFGGLLFTRSSKVSSETVACFLASGSMAFVLISLLPLVSNQFGFDREGFRALVLLPTPRQQMLLGKNLALLPIAAVLGIVGLILLQWIVRIPVLVVGAAAFQYVAAFFITCGAGNLVSILAPHRIAAGAMKPTKMPFKMAVIVFILHLLFPLAMLPLFIPPALGALSGAMEWLPVAPVHLVASILLAVLCGFGYRASLGALGDLLQRRERRILTVVTQEVE